MIDFHAHISQKPEPIPNDKDVLLSQILAMGEEVTHYATAEELVAGMRINSVETACIQPMAGLSPHKATKMNDVVREAMLAYSSLIGFACINPHSPSAEEEVDRVLRENGLRGLVVDSEQGFDFSGSNFWRALEMAKNHASAIFVHHENMGGEFFDVDDINDTVMSFSRVNFVFPLIKSKGILPEPNVYLDTAHAETLEIEKVLEKWRPDNILFGSDSKYNLYPSHEIAKIGELSINETEKEKMLGGNASRILGLQKAKKGKGILERISFLKGFLKGPRSDEACKSSQKETKTPPTQP